MTGLALLAVLAVAAPVALAAALGPISGRVLSYESVSEPVPAGTEELAA